MWTVDRVTLKFDFAPRAYVVRYDESPEKSKIPQTTPTLLQKMTVSHTPSTSFLLGVHMSAIDTPINTGRQPQSSHAFHEQALE